LVAQGDWSVCDGPVLERDPHCRSLPAFDWLARLTGSKALAASILTMLSLMIVLGPVIWLGFAMMGGIELLVKGIDTGQLYPMPPTS
jgi:hypothetical protein